MRISIYCLPSFTPRPVLQTKVINLPGIKGSALFGTIITGTGTRTTGFPFYAVRPGMKMITIPSPHLRILARLSGSASAIPTQMRFISVTNLIRKTDRNRKLNGRFLTGVHRISTVIRIIHYFRSSSVVRISNSMSPIHSVRIVSLRLTLTSLTRLRQQMSQIHGLTHTSGRTRTRLTVLRGVLPILGRNGATHRIPLSRRTRTVVGPLKLLAHGPIVCTTGISRSSLTDNGT